MTIDISFCCSCLRQLLLHALTHLKVYLVFELLKKAVIGGYREGLMLLWFLNPENTEDPLWMMHLWLKVHIFLHNLLRWFFCCCLKASIDSFFFSVFF